MNVNALVCEHVKSGAGRQTGLSGEDRKLTSKVGSLRTSRRAPRIVDDITFIPADRLFKCSRIEKVCFLIRRN